MCTAQQVKLEKDLDLTTKDTVSFSIQNYMLSPLYFVMNPNDSVPSSIIYRKKTLLQPSEKLLNFIKIPTTLLDSTSNTFDFYAYFDFKAGYSDPNTVKHDDSYLYLLPYKKKKKLVQGNFGNFSHDHIGSHHAFDFGTQIGDTLYAAREGKVVMLKEDSKTHGRTREFSNFANYIIIQHDDGTTASYYHLDFNGVLVEKGDLVTRGQKIGISGMTGFTTLPHVHFVVHKTTLTDGNVSVPIEFEGYVGKKFKKGKWYARK